MGIFQQIGPTTNMGHVSHNVPKLETYLKDSHLLTARMLLYGTLWILIARTFTWGQDIKVYSYKSMSFFFRCILM